MVSIFHSPFLLNPWRQYGNQKKPPLFKFGHRFFKFQGMLFVQNFNALGIVLEDYRLKCCTLKEDTKINISGSTSRFSKVPPIKNTILRSSLSSQYQGV